MSRAIKFRAWSNEYHRYCDFVTLDEDGEWTGWVRTCGVSLSTTDIVLEQYTGLKDKNGKDIYEGDIIESTWNGDKAEVVWNDVEGEWEHYADFNTHSKYSGSVVIGNIHENPELLGGEE